MTTEPPTPEQARSSKLWLTIFLSTVEGTATYMVATVCNNCVPIVPIKDGLIGPVLPPPPQPELLAALLRSRNHLDRDARHAIADLLDRQGRTAGWFRFQKRKSGRAVGGKGGDMNLGKFIDDLMDGDPTPKLWIGVEEGPR